MKALLLQKPGQASIGSENPSSFKKILVSLDNQL